MIGTTCSWKREFTVNKFIIFSNKLEIILNNVIEKGIKTGTSSKGYTSEFTGFAEVITKMKSKLKKGTFVSEEISVAVDIDYNKSVSSQIEPGLVGLINRIQGPILRLMHTFGINEPSEFCDPVNTILDICRIYCSYNKEINSVPI